VSGCARILLTGGGTAGHVNPALAIGRALGGEQSKFLYVGVAGRAEADVVPREGLPLAFVRSAAFPGLRPSPAWIPFVLNLTAGTLKAAWLLRRFKPEVIVATGGFASAPIVFATSVLRRLGLLKTRLYVHEQNAAPGTMNLLAGRLADRVFVSFPETVALFPGKGVLTGYPLRGRIQVGARDACRAALDFQIPEGRQVVFAFGGSQGARTINHAIVDALAELLPHRDRLFIIHGTGLRPKGRGYDPGGETETRLEQRYGKAERQMIDTFYVRRPYFHGIEHVYGLTDLAVVRAGAGTLNEIASLGLPSIVVPKVNLSGEHQVMNARSLAQRGGAVVLYEETRLTDGVLTEVLDGHVLAATIVGLLGDKSRLATMSQSAHDFVHGNALEVIRQYVEADLSGQAGTLPVPDVPPAGRPMMGNHALLACLERGFARNRDGYLTDGQLACADDRAYYISRAASLLASPSWETRNLGIKLIGLLRATGKLPLVLAILADRRPAAWYKRLLGGDFEQVGFIRRNALTTIARLGCVTPAVEQALLAALADPYFEARAEAARTIAALDAQFSDEARTRLVTKLTTLLADRWLEVAAAAAETLGHVGDHSQALPVLLGLQGHRYWMVRAAGLKGLLSLIERGKAGDLTTLETRVRGFVLTATDFRPEFQIKTAFARVIDAIAARRGAAS
jgi:UDP-N-acetylglucosamine--N-acetylmuramyl-(pentapeptide) pyrophosphoryl-undecaprenol N-acetylglucosamine transferase